MSKAVQTTKLRNKTREDFGVKNFFGMKLRSGRVVTYERGTISAYDDVTKKKAKEAGYDTLNLDQIRFLLKKPNPV